MTEWKLAVAKKAAELVGKGWTAEAAAKRARKTCRHLHPAHRAAMIRRIESADVAATVTGTFHTP